MRNIPTAHVIQQVQVIYTNFFNQMLSNRGLDAIQTNNTRHALNLANKTRISCAKPAISRQHTETHPAHRSQAQSVAEYRQTNFGRCRRDVCTSPEDSPNYSSISRPELTAYSLYVHFTTFQSGPLETFKFQGPVRGNRNVSDRCTRNEVPDIVYVKHGDFFYWQAQFERTVVN